MKKLISKIPLIICLLNLSCCVFAKPPDSNNDYSSLILGKWVSINRSEGGLGGSYIFAEKNKIVVLYGAIIDYEYEVVEDRIYEKHMDEAQVINTFKFDGDKLVITRVSPGTDQCEFIMKRIGNQGENSMSIVGKWAFKDKSGVWAIQEFLDNGHAQLTVPLVYETGQYDLKNNMLTFKLDGEEPKNKIIHIQNNILKISTVNGQVDEIYSRFK